MRFSQFTTTRFVAGLVAECHGRDSARLVDRFGCLPDSHRHSWRQTFWFLSLWCELPSRIASSNAPKSQFNAGTHTVARRPLSRHDQRCR